MRELRKVWPLVLSALAWLAWVAPAAADLQGVGSEVGVGANGTGEACRLRLVQADAARGYQRLNLYCDGWSVSSGALFRFRVTKDFTPERILTDSQTAHPFFWAPFVLVGDGGATP